MCETCFVNKKSCRKKFFQKLKFLPYMGSELVKIFEKWGRKIFLRFFGFDQRKNV